LLPEAGAPCRRLRGQRGCAGWFSSCMARFTPPALGTPRSGLAPAGALYCVGGPIGLQAVFVHAQVALHSLGGWNRLAWPEWLALRMFLAVILGVCKLLLNFDIQSLLVAVPDGSLAMRMVGGLLILEFLLQIETLAGCWVSNGEVSESIFASIGGWANNLARGA
jgi:hypothetical protein